MRIVPPVFSTYETVIDCKLNHLMEDGTILKFLFSKGMLKSICSARKTKDKQTGSQLWKTYMVIWISIDFRKLIKLTSWSYMLHGEGGDWI